MKATAEQLWQLPDDGYRRELVAGELRVMTPAGAEHGRVTATVGILLGAHVRASASGRPRLEGRSGRAIRLISALGIARSR